MGRIENSSVLEVHAHEHLFFSCVLGSFKPCFVFSHPFLHLLLTMTRVIHYISVSFSVMWSKGFHPFFKCFTFRRYFA